MNDTTAPAPGSSLLPDSIGAITAVHFVLMALVAIAAVAIIVAGIRRKRIRARAEEQVEARAEEAGVVATAAEPEPEPEPATPDATQPERTVTPPPLADEPIAAAAPMEATPASVAADIPVATTAVAPVAAALVTGTGSPADGPVTQLKGLGPKLAERLAALGITTVGQLAAMSDDEAAVLDAQLGPFAGRIARDRWIEQSRFLAAGDRAGFEAVFGRL